jgi:hypothetical protein
MKKIAVFALVFITIFSFSNLGVSQDESGGDGENAVKRIYSKKNMSPSARLCYLEYQLCNRPVQMPGCYDDFMDCIKGDTDYEPVEDFTGTACQNMCNIDYKLCKMKESASAEEHDGAGAIFFCGFDKDACIQDCNQYNDD